MLKLKKSRPSREESQSQTRERLLASAREVFAKNGYEGASVDLIAENVGFSKGAFYSNFENKEELFLLLLERHKEREVKALKDSLDATGTLEKLFESIGAFYADLEGDLDWGLLSAEFQMQASRDPLFAKHVSKFYRDQRIALGKLIEVFFGKARKKIPAPPEELAAIFMGLASGLSLQRAADKSAIRRGLLGDAILLVLKSILANSSTA